MGAHSVPRPGAGGAFLASKLLRGLRYAKCSARKSPDRAGFESRRKRVDVARCGRRCEKGRSDDRGEDIRLAAVSGTARPRPSQDRLADDAAPEARREVRHHHPAGRPPVLPLRPQLHVVPGRDQGQCGLQPLRGVREHSRDGPGRPWRQHHLGRREPAHRVQRRHTASSSGSPTWNSASWPRRPATTSTSIWPRPTIDFTSFAPTTWSGSSRSLRRTIP